VSPCSPITAYPAPQLSVTDLAASFGRSRLRADAQICYDDCNAYAGNPDEDAGWSLDPLPASSSSYETASRSSSSRTSGRSTTHRARRQSNSRLLCSTAHHKDIAALVARMVDCQEQCSVAVAGSSSVEDDEGYDSYEYFDPEQPHPPSANASAAPRRPRLEYRRSMDLKTGTNGGACVSKSIRMRKDRVQKRRS
jgi:hypothetical protein